MKRMNSQLGYTLLQLLLALEFGTVVAAVGAPKVFDAYAFYQLKATANQVGFDIARARMEAIGQNKYVRIQMQSSQYLRQVSNDGSTWTTETTRTLPNNVSAYSNSEVRFDRRGFATVNNWMLLMGGGRYRWIFTSLIGRSTIY